MRTVMAQDQAGKVDGHESMRRNGKSFWFASLLLPRTIAADAAELYAFCRTMDDLADESDDPESVKRLQNVRVDLQHGSSDDPSVQALLALAARYPLDLQVADHLVESFVADAATRVRIITEQELIRYCFGVAGTVGLMMSSILGADLAQAHLHAIDLGIAMQMTNIARDVLEDARNGRRYLPGCWVQELSPADLVNNDPASHECVSAAILHLLDLADHFYASAALGFRYLPARNRPAIEVAATVYREIGVSLRRSGVSWRGPRTVVPPFRKSMLAASVLLGTAPLNHLSLAESSDEMHQPLVGLPGAA